MKHTLLLTLVFLTCFLQPGCKDKQTGDKEVVNNQMKDTEKSTENVNDEKNTILCFGNSLTAGYGLEENQAWPYLLQMRIDSLEMSYKVINAGLSGETSSGGLSRIEWVLNQPADIFILELGANDMLRGIDVSSTERNLDSILTIVKKTNPDTKIVIAGMLSPPNMGASYEKQFNSLFTRISERHEGKLIPFFLENVAGVPDLNLPDAKHPNEKGQHIVLENVWTVLEDML
ncbi:MAG: arylesterase [Bacteroidia bacterium]|nr:arylesterase [Bacteroidia bacterium]